MDQKSNPEDPSTAESSSNLQRFQETVKSQLYSVYYMILGGENIKNTTVSMCFIIIETFQLLRFPFHSELGGVWKRSNVFSSLQNFFGYFSILPLLKSGSFSIYLSIFYLTQIIFFIVIIDIFYIIYMNAKKKQVLQWPLTLLRLFCELNESIIFIPFFELFTSIFQCVSDSNGKSVHAIFSEVKCNSETFILHSFISTLSSICYLIFSLIQALLFYECRYSSFCSNSKWTGKISMLVFFYKTIIILLLTFLKGAEYEILFVAVIAISTYSILFNFNKALIYYQKRLTKVFNIQYVLICWSALILIYEKITQNFLQDAGIYIWITGVPLLITVILLKEDNKYELLLTNANNFDSPMEAFKFVLFLSVSLNNYSSDRAAAINLEGFVEYHKTVCKHEDCASKRKTLKITKNTKILREEGISDQVIIIIQLLQQIYLHSIKRFPKYTPLKIHYALFLMDLMRSKQQALQEFLHMDSEYANFVESFTIFRFRRLIEEDLIEIQNETKGNNYEIVNELTSQNHIKQMRIQIERSSSLHMEFWSQLIEDTPDLGRLCEIGNKINIVQTKLHEHWSYLQRMKVDTVSLMRLYAKFLTNIINDKEGAEHILQRIKTVSMNNTRKRNLDFTSFSDCLDSSPTLFLSAEEDNFGIITNLNLAATQLFGYNKMEIMNRRVNMLMPDIYGRHHDTFLENYLNTLEPRILNKERMVVAKHKNNYVFPVYIYVRHVPSLIHGLQFIGQFSPERNFKQTCFILVENLSGKILNLSSSSINVLQIDLKKLAKNSTKIIEWIPDFFEKIGNYTCKSGSAFELDNGSTINVNAFEISFRNIGCVGYGVFIEKLRIGSPLHNKRKTHPRIKQIFTIKYDFTNNIYYGQLHLNSEKYEDSTEDYSFIGTKVDSSKLLVDTNNDTATHQGEQTRNDCESPFLKKYGGFDYGAGIKTMRLVLDRIFDVEDLKREEGSDEEEDEKQNYKRGNSQGTEAKSEYFKSTDKENEEVNDLGQTFKSRNAFLKFVRESNFVHSRTLTKFKIIGISALIILFAIGITAYVLVSGYFSSFNHSYIMLSYSHRKIALSQSIMNKLLNLYQVNLDLNPNKTLDAADLKNDIRDHLSNLEEVIKFHQNAQQEYSEYDKTNLDVIVSFPENTTLIDRTFKMNEALQQIISKVLKIINQNLSDFQLNNTDFIFLNFNLMNNLYLSMEDSSEIFRKDLSEKVEFKDFNILIWLIVGCSFMAFRLLIVIPLFKKVSNEPKEILKIFLEIPSFKLKELFSKCENFSNHLQLGEEDDAHSESSGQAETKDEDEDDLSRHTKTRRKKKFKISTNSSSKFLLQIFFMTGLMILYFTGTYLISYYYWDKMKSFLNEFNASSSAEYKYLFINNAFKDLAFDSTFPVMSKQSRTVVANYITLLYNQNSIMQKEHSVNFLKHDSHYTSAQEFVFTKSLCSLSEINLDSFMNEQRCKEFDLGIATEGLGVLLPRILENFRFLSTLFENAEKNITALDNIDQFTNISLSICKSHNLNRILCTLTSVINNIMTDKVVSKAFQFLNKSFLESLDSEYSTAMGIRMILFIIFIIMIVFSYLFVWFPVMNELNRDLFRTRVMITMIPLSIVASTRSIKDYIIKLSGQGTGA